VVRISPAAFAEVLPNGTYFAPHTARALGAAMRPAACATRGWNQRRDGCKRRVARLAVNLLVIERFGDGVGVQFSVQLKEKRLSLRAWKPLKPCSRVSVVSNR
jgi:hypothetical protein